MAAQSSPALVEGLAEAQRSLGPAPCQAAARAREILNSSPDRFEALFILGAAKRRSDDLDGALSILQPLAATQPTAWGVHFELGATLAALGRTSAAVLALRQAVQINPRSSLAWQALSDQLLLADDVAGAAEAASQALAGSIHDPDLLQVARDLFGGAVVRAEAKLADRFQMHLSDLMVVRLLAEAGLRLGSPHGVEAFLRAHLKRAPRFAPLRHSLVLALKGRLRFQEALDELEPLLVQTPGNLAFLCLKAAVLTELGAYQQALDIYGAVLERHPDHPQVWLSYGHLLKIVGRKSDCVSAYRRSLSLAPTLGEAYWSLANLKTVRFEAADVTAMAALLGDADLKLKDRTPLHFALGKALEDAERFDEAFEHYRQGAACRRATAPYDARAHRAFIQDTMATFTAQFLEARRGAGDGAPDPIFIVGLPRSGSTLVEQMLSCHSQIEATSELPHLTAIARGVWASQGHRAYPAMLADINLADFARLGGDYLSRAQRHRSSSRPFFIDKFPNNFLHVGLIRLILPNAKIIDVRRNALGCCLSAFKQLFAEGQDYSYDLADLGAYYADYVALMDHFDAAAPGRVHHVVYERLVERPEVELRRLMAYCDLDFEPSCLLFHTSRRAVRTASSDQVRSPIFRHGIDHWRHFDPWLGPLKRALGPKLCSE